MEDINEQIKRAKEVRGMNIVKVVDDPEWQEVRKSLVGYWVKDHKRNVGILRGYFNKHKKDPMALRRLVNVLTGSVHRTGITKGQKETDELRKDVRIAWKTMQGETWDPKDPKYATGEI